MLGDPRKIPIGCQERATVLHASRRDQAVNSTHLDTMGATPLSYLCCRNVGFAFQGQQGKWLQKRQEPVKILPVPQAIQQLLEDAAHKKDGVI